MGYTCEEFRVTYRIVVISLYSCRSSLFEVSKVYGGGSMLYVSNESLGIETFIVWWSPCNGHKLALFGRTEASWIWIYWRRRASSYSSRQEISSLVWERPYRGNRQSAGSWADSAKWHFDRGSYFKFETTLEWVRHEKWRSWDIVVDGCIMSLWGYQILPHDWSIYETVIGTEYLFSGVCLILSVQLIAFSLAPFLTQRSLQWHSSPPKRLVVCSRDECVSQTVSEASCSYSRQYTAEYCEQRWLCMRSLLRLLSDARNINFYGVGIAPVDDTYHAANPVTSTR